MPALPFKLNQDRRRHIPRQTHKVTNWPAYDASLRQRGSLTVWFTDEAIEAWAAEPRTTRGGQPWYSALAILTALPLRAVFRLAYRQAEGLIGSIVGLLGLALRVPDHTTLSRRAAPVAADGDRPAAGRRRRAWKGAAQRSTHAAGRGAPGCTQRQRRKLGDPGRPGRAGGGGLVPLAAAREQTRGRGGSAWPPEG